MRHEFPHARRGEVIGLLGGSFDPPHAGHLHISKAALTRFRLDRVWWVVSPGNPLKERGPAPMAQRMEAARAMIRHPRIDVTDIEADLGTRYTADTIRKITALYPHVRFVWLMGADNLVQFHLWQDWEEILYSVPMGVLARPGERMPARLSRTARIHGAARLPSKASELLGRCRAPTWCFVNLPLSPASSTAIRESGGWRPRS
jgi:nicotinate-nucleotide adenylyltransferase